MATELPPITVEEPPQSTTPGSSTEGLIRVPITKSDTKPLDPLPLRLAGPNREIATIITNGQHFTNWTSLRIENRITETHPTFQFELTEESPVPVTWGKAQLAPGAQVQVYLGDYLAVTGFIIERHVAFDAKNHAVRLVGTGKTYDTTNSSVPLAAQDGHDGKNIKQISEALTKHLGINVRTLGNVNMTPFENVQVQPGEPIMTMIERYARARRVVIGSDQHGNLLLIGPHKAVTSDVVEHLVEGQNMLRANAVVKDDVKYREMFAIGQQAGSNQVNGDAANKQIAKATGTSTRNRQLVIPMEIADIKQGVKERVEMEKIFSEGAEIEAHITVQGWFRKDGHPWRAGEYYWVESPSLILNRLLGCKGCIYEQSNSGTTTTLEMVRPIHMNGNEAAMYDVDHSKTQQPPGFTLENVPTAPL